MRLIRSDPWLPVYGQIDLKDCTFKLKDGGANELEIKIGEGNLTWTEGKNIEYIPDRGTLDEVREGDQIPMDVTFEFTWLYLVSPSSSSSSGGATPTIEDALKQNNAAADWASSDADTCRPYALDIEILNAPTPSACGDKETITLPDFRYESLAHDVRAGQISCSGKCNAVEPTVVRAAQ